MPIDYPALGKRIAFFRNQSHLTQEDFAYEVHLSRQYISQLKPLPADQVLKQS